MIGNIFDVQRLCIHDGPGIRTTVFLKGCPLRCIWCHNPESHRAEASLAYYQDKCVSCGACAALCAANCHKILDGHHHLDRQSCALCGKCASHCPQSALEMIGRQETVDSILEEVKRDLLFYQHSGGGLTVSGGEPLMQGEFLIALLRGAKEMGIHTAVETCGYGRIETLTEVAKYTDLFLFDVKETDEMRHEALTGVPFSPIKENLLRLDRMGAKIILRCPLIPNVNTEKEHLLAIARLAASLDGILEVNVMAYHLLGSGKYDALGVENRMRGQEAMTAKEKDACIKIIADEIERIGTKAVPVV